MLDEENLGINMNINLDNNTFKGLTLMRGVQQIMFKDLNNTAKWALNYVDYNENNIIIDKTHSKIKKVIYLCVKRLFDIFFGVFGCLLLIPISLIIKIITVCSGDFSSIFYYQDRIGLNGKVFRLYKFRSMVSNADEVLKDILKTDNKAAEEYKEMKKLNKDPRITKIGKFLRKTSLDELPQFINVLKGEMSLIGNRPYLPREKDDMKDYYEDIIKTKPGISGFWQCSLRSRGTFEQRLMMEKYYSNNVGLRFDIKIILKTIGMVIGQDGAK